MPRPKRQPQPGGRELRIPPGQHWDEENFSAVIFRPKRKKRT